MNGQKAPSSNWTILLALAGAVVALVAVLLSIQVRTDMGAFLPEGRTDAARMVLGEARSGAATGILLVGLEGASTADLARVSVSMAAALTASGRFTVVAGGPGAGLDRDVLFAHRFLLSPGVTAAAFSTSGLRTGMEAVLRSLQSSAAPVALEYGLADPVGAFFALLKQWGSSPVRTIDGAWFSPDGTRALLLARTRAGGMDIPGQEAALATIEAAFRDAKPGQARLLVAGPGAFARDAARAIRGDVERISVISTLLVAGLLWWRFRRPLVLAAIAAPVVLSVAVAASVVQLLFGSVHGVALGFGATMLGVSVDYPVLMIGHRKQNEAARATRARIGRAFLLAVICAVLGLLAMIASGFPGLMQLGVFAAAGLVACGALTWVVLPRLIVRANLAPVAATDPAWLARIEGWRRHRLWGLLPVAAAAAYLAVHGVAWEGDLQALSPVPAASVALDRALRAGLGAPEAGQVVLVRGATAQAVLERQEALLPALDALRDAGALHGFEAAARVLPSVAMQRSRQALLPDAAELARRVADAQSGLPFKPGAFAPFLDAVASARVAAPLLPADLAGTLLGARLSPVLLQRDGAWVGPIVLQGVVDPAAIRAAMGPAFIDVRAELGTVLSDYTTRGWRWLGVSFVVVLGVLVAGLRDWRVARVLGALAAAMLVTIAVLTLAGARLSLIHLVALQLVAGVGLDYALFFARRQLDEEERARTVRTLVTCNGMTLLTFGLLAGCQTPLLRDIGVTVALGALLAMVFSHLFAGRAPHERI
jgi:predicted exporter